MAETEKKATKLTLFGSSEGWSADDWTASDDRVRGGKSHSYLEIDEDTARFHGNLDIKTLGGAGFASQRTTGDDRKYDLSDYAGIALEIAKGDKKRYTFILKDDLLPPDEETGREQSSISWECDFELPPQTKPGHAYDKTVYIPFDSFNPTYRGKVKKDADPLDLKKIKRFSIMMRSFFGAQEGDFSLKIKSISASTKAPKTDESITSRVKNDDPQKLEAGTTGGTPSYNQYYTFTINSWLGSGRISLHRRFTTFVLVGLVVGFAVYNSVFSTRR